VGADAPTAEEVLAATGADSLELETCSAIAAAISRDRERLPSSANAATASASEGATLAATVTFGSLTSHTSMFFGYVPAEVGRNGPTGAGFTNRVSPRRRSELENAGAERKIVARMPKPPVAPNLARVCECGWTNYPQPIANGNPLRVEWRVAETCSGCGAPLERHTDMAKTAGASA
jgi:hypothetical protein